MSTLEVDQSGEIGHVHHPNRQVLIDGFLRFSYPMPDQERGEGWMMFLYERLSQSLIDQFEA